MFNCKRFVVGYDTSASDRYQDVGCLIGSLLIVLKSGKGVKFNRLRLREATCCHLLL
jgi:hypothetical protein